MTASRRQLEPRLVIWLRAARFRVVSVNGERYNNNEIDPVVTKSPLPNLNLDPLESCSPGK